MEWIFIFVFVTLHSKFVNLIDVPENITSYPCTDQNHIFLVPGVLTAGGSSRACVSRFHHAGPVRMVVTLRAEGQPAVTAVRELSEGDGGCIDILVPLLPNTKAEMAVNLRYPEAHCAWERRIEIRIGGARVVVAHTERARYRPGELVRARVFVLKPDLTPAHGPIEEIWLEGPRGGSWEGSRAVEWRRERTRLGTAQLQHQLDGQAPPGLWSLRVRLADGSQGAAAFHVGDYELPPFQLSVRHAPKVLSTSDRLVWTVCVRYPWTEAVEGMLVIRIRGAGGSSNSNGIHTAVRLRAPRACHRHAAAARRIGLNGATPPDVVVADFSFQEESTRIWQNTTVVSQIVDKAVTLEFLTKHHAVISPWLPHKLKVKATRWDNKPAANEHVKVCRTPAPSPELMRQTEEDTLLYEGVCKEAITDAAGVARVLFLAEDDGSSFCRFRATLKNDSSISAAPLFLPVQRQGSVHAVLGPLKSDGQDIRTFVPLYLSLKKVTNALTVHFVVITRGGIIYRWGATTQCPLTNPNDPIQTASRDSRCYTDNIFDVNEYIHSSLIFNQSHTSSKAKGSQTFNQDSTLLSRDSNGFDSEHNVSDALSDKPLLRVMLPVKVSHQMCPDSHLIAYFYYKGELVSTSKHFEMEECFDNKVEATFISRQASPGSTTSLQLKTSGPALCALTALDVASKWVQPAPSVKEVLLAGLTRLVQGHRNLTEYDAAGDCFLKWDEPTIPTTSLQQCGRSLAGAGLRLVGGNGGQRRAAGAAGGCPTAPPALLRADCGAVPRSDFSEAWLWRLVLVGANGTATVDAKVPDSITRYEATAVCVAKTGVDISQPAVLQVFREFFIHADGPKKLRRGDTCIISYRLFNYLYEPLNVQIQVLTDPHFEGPKDFIETACIGARSSVARRVEVTATLPGNARVSVRAMAVLDGSCANATKSGVSDEVIIQITVDPEGVLVKEQKSILLCGKGSKESSTSEVSWSWPEVAAVPGTEALMLWAVGDVTGPLFADADELVTLPRGCGEQNLARMATNLMALSQLDPASDTYAIAKQHVARGFIRQLQYVHPLGGFSAFGAGDVSPSTWLTAFAMRYMKKAHMLLHPGSPLPPSLSRAESWLLAQQMENGCFRNEGQVFHRELRGGLSEEGEMASVALTAYVLTALMDGAALPAGIVRNALSCLRALATLKSNSPTRIYAHSLVSYAFMRLRRYEDEVQKMNEASVWDRDTPRGLGMGGTGGTAGTVHRGAAGAAGLRQDEELRQLAELLETASRARDLVWWDTGSLASSIEATGYALLALSAVPADLREPGFALDPYAAIRWLSTHRNPTGGFVATQDTLVALEALTTWSFSQSSSPTRLQLTVRSGALTRTAVLLPGVKAPVHIRMGAGYSLTVGVEGTGCGLIQATRYYNALTVDQKDSRDNGTIWKPLSVQVTVHTDGAFNCEANQTNCYCAAIIETCVLWAGAFPEMALLEVNLPGGYGVDASLLYSQLNQGNNLVRRIELSPSRITYYLASASGAASGPGPGSGAGSGAGGHQCCRAAAVGPRVRTQPALVSVRSYYAPDISDSQMYTISEDCPPRITHESSQYLPSENLFVKARSGFGNDGSLVSTNFPFHDIPDGIPLEDPLYDNLTKDNFKDKIQKEKHVNAIEGEKSLNLEKLMQITGVKQNSENIINESDEIIFHNVNNNSNLEEKNNTKLEEVLESATAKYRITHENHELMINDSEEVRTKNNTGQNTANIDINRHNYNRKSNETLIALSYSVTDNMKIKEKNKEEKHKYTRFDNSTIEKENEFFKRKEMEDKSFLNRKEILNTDYSVKEKGNDLIKIKEIKENRFLQRKDMLSTDYNNKLNAPDDEIERIVGIDMNSGNSPLKQPKRSRRVKFFTDEAEEVITGDTLSFDPKPLEVQLNFGRSAGQNKVPKTAEIEIINKETAGAVNQDTKLLKTSEQEIRKQELNKKDILTVDNPSLSKFHIIESVHDLDVPSGIEGPIPAIALPPPGMSRNYVTKPYFDQNFQSERQSDQQSNFHSQSSPIKLYPSDQHYQNDQPIPAIALAPPEMSRNYVTNPNFDQNFQSRKQSHQQSNFQLQSSPNKLYPPDQLYQNDQSYRQPILALPPPEMLRNSATKPHLVQNFQSKQQSNFQSQASPNKRYPSDQHFQNEKTNHRQIPALPPSEMSRNSATKPYFDQNFQSRQQSHQQSNFQSQLLPNKHHPTDQNRQNDQPYPQRSPDISLPEPDRPRNYENFDQNRQQSNDKLYTLSQSSNKYHPHDQHSKDGQPYQMAGRQISSYQQHMFGDEPYLYHQPSPRFNPDNMAIEYGKGH